MGRATTKQDLLEAANNRYNMLQEVIAGLDAKEMATPFMFANDEKKKEAHWARDKNLRDVLIHLYEWHNLLFNWVSNNQKGERMPFIPLPYNWKTYGEMNVMFWQKHQSTTLEEAKSWFENSHYELVQLIESFSNEELFSKNIFKWVGGSTLGSYFVSVSASHYEWAMKKLKAHKKVCATKKEG